VLEKGGNREKGRKRIDKGQCKVNVINCTPTWEEGKQEKYDFRTGQVYMVFRFKS
jgi:hypothetical protein